MKLSLGISPCPNDTFIFDALIHGHIDTGGLSFNVYLEDVQTLNEWALANKLDITKLSYGVWPLIQSTYHLLQSGGALGRGVGPLFITLPERLNAWKQGNLQNPIVALPGKNTTAHFLFNYAYTGDVHKKFMPFHKIETAVVNGDADAGVIIHENRFTYADRGLVLIEDLGHYWETKTALPIPLGGIVAKKSLDQAVIQKVDQCVAASLQYAWQNHYPDLSDFVKKHAQEMQPEVMKQHIDLYVNDYSMQLGSNGMQAVEMLIQQARLLH